MADKKDVFAAAIKLIDRFSDNAAEEAERRALELKGEGKREAYLFWLEVLEQVRALIEQRGAGKPN